MNRKLSLKARKNIETGVQVFFGLAAATPLLLDSSGVNTAIGAGAAVLAVSVFVTNLMQVPAVERLLDKFTADSGTLQPVKALQSELTAARSLLAAHEARLHASSGTPSAAAAAVDAASAAPASPASAAEAAAPVAGAEGSA